MSLERVNMEAKHITHKQVIANLWFKRKNTPIVCLTTGETFLSANEAERKTGIWGTSILNCCDGKKRTAGKKEWDYV